MFRSVLVYRLSDIFATLHIISDADCAVFVPESRGDEAGGEVGSKRVREVVLLTDDRNLRVKALAAELPTRDLPSFVQWAGLGRDDATAVSPCF